MNKEIIKYIHNFEEYVFERKGWFANAFKIFNYTKYLA